MLGRSAIDFDLVVIKYPEQLGKARHEVAHSTRPVGGRP